MRESEWRRGRASCVRRLGAYHSALLPALDLCGFRVASNCAESCRNAGRTVLAIRWTQCEFPGR